MKKLSIVLIAAACLLGACKKEDQKEKVVLGTAIEEVNSNQKAYIDGDYYVCFAKNDVVKVNNEDVTIAADGRTGDISVTRTSSYNAVYPKSILNNQNSAVPTTGVSIVLPNEQIYKEKTMGGVTRQVVDMPMAGYLGTETGTIQFRNLCSVLRIIIHNDKTITLGIKRITVRSSHAKLCGSGTIADIRVSNPEIVMTGTSAVQDEVSLQMNNVVNVAPNNKKEFYIVIPAIPSTASSNKFTIEVVADSLVNNVSCGTFRYSKTQGSTKTGYIPRNKLGSAAFHLDRTTPPDYPYLILDCGSGSNSKRLMVAPGNLQYQASSDSWRFAAHGYDFIGGASLYYGTNGWTTNFGATSNDLTPNNRTYGGKINGTAYGDRKTQSGWIDLFGWGTSGKGAKRTYPSGYNNWCEMPYAAENNAFNNGNGNYDYTKYYGPASGNLTATNKYDWGVNEILNQRTGNKETGWRTLTKDEWDCLIESKDQYGYACFKETRYTDASGMNRTRYEGGIVLLPKGFIDPECCTEHQNINGQTVQSGNKKFLPSSAFPANTEGAFNQNIYTKSDWDKMEAAGAIFLPATGTRGLFSIQDAPQPIHGGVASQYWTSTRIDDYEAWCFRFENVDLTAPIAVRTQGSRKDAGCAVRLFKDVQ
ncbi:MAG: hypothetical protein IKO98_09205 [Bacteroidales bacterium]|nr:hypothetical protein [Bacteroidales bacterium]